MKLVPVYAPAFAGTHLSHLHMEGRAGWVDLQVSAMLRNK